MAAIERAIRSPACVLVLLVLLGTAVRTARAADSCTDGGSLLPLAGDGIGGTGISGDGIGGTGVVPRQGDSEGIGGTGAIAGDPDEGGIGGTGVFRDADSGIVGVVTGFASICVGGREIHYASDTPVSVDGALADAGALAVGQVVEVAARADRAVAIAVRHEIEGEISAVDRGRNRFTVLGQAVELTTTTWTDLEGGPALAEAAMFEVGDLVRVGGFRGEEDAVVATRVELLDDALAGLRGKVSEVGSDYLVVSGVRVRTDGAPAAAVGDVLRVEGAWDGQVLRARHLERQPALPFDGLVQQVDLEGIVRPGSQSGQVTVGSFDVDRGPAGPALRVGDRVRIEARIRDGAVVAERVAPLRPRVPPRRSSVSGSLPRAVPSDGGTLKAAPAPPRPKVRPRAPAQRPNAAAPPRPLRPQRAERPPRPPRPERPQRPERPPRPERPIRPLLPRRR